jgi:hypothetical protein
MHLYPRTRARTHACTHARAHTHAHAHAHAHTHTHTHTHSYAHTHTHAHTHTRTHTRTHTHQDVDDFCEEHPEVVILCSSILSTAAVLRSLPVQRLKRNTLFVDVLSVKVGAASAQGPGPSAGIRAAVLHVCAVLTRCNPAASGQPPHYLFCQLAPGIL